jgi:uncharacterized protein (TIGR03435 family)
VPRILKIAIAASLLLTVGYGQTKPEFEAASIRVNPPRAGFHFASDSSTGGPGTADPGMYRCTSCSLATLILKAFDLQGYQFPGKSSLTDRTFDVMAKIPAGATQDEFRSMLQNLLKDRFGLAWHYKEKALRGYHSTIAAKGSKLKESTAGAGPPSAAAGRGAGPAESHSHTGVMNFGPTARYTADHRTTADLARVLSDQLSVPVDDQTGLKGEYDIALSWSGNGSHEGAHSDGAFAGGGHGDHGPPAGAAPRTDGSGATLFEALQTQLGLRLVPSDQTVARIFIIDHVESVPTAN